MSTREVLVKDLAQYIGRRISYTFNDGWEEWSEGGILVALDTPANYHLTYIYCCNCEDECDLEPSDHGGYAMSEFDPVYVSTGGKRP